MFDISTKYIELYGIGGLHEDLSQYCSFHQDILHRYILAICYIHHCLYGTGDAYKFISSSSIFIFTVVMKVLVKPSVFASKF